LKTFFDPQTRLEVMERLLALDPASAPRWGTMNAAQMVAHCTEGMKMGTGELKVSGGLPGLIGWLFKALAYDDRRFRANAPTAKELKIADARDFELEKAQFLAMFLKLSAGPSALGSQRHPFFGTLTPEQWGKLLYKHLDHHFRQFGV
jgi:hypothetical protein